MSQIELLQSVLQKLGSLSASDLADLDAYLSLKIKRKVVKRKSKIEQSNVSKAAGAWKDWNDSEFEDFLRLTQIARDEMFADRVSAI